MSNEDENRRPIKVLLVDDDDSILYLLRNLMEKLGVESSTALNGESALKLFDKEKPDIVFSDIQMPLLDGIGLLEEIRARDREIPVILFTGDPLNKYKVEASKHKPNRLLFKPLNINDIIEILLNSFPAR